MEAVGRQPVPDPELGPASWSRRYKQNVERLRSGDRGRITEVVRQLSGRERAMGISEGERRMLARARQMLDDPGDGTAGVREPRRPIPPDDAMSVASEPDPETCERPGNQLSNYCRLHQRTLVDTGGRSVPGQVGRARSIDYDYRVELSDGTRPAGGEPSDWALGLGQQVAAWAQFPPLILPGHYWTARAGPAAVVTIRIVSAREHAVCVHVLLQAQGRDRLYLAVCAVGEKGQGCKHGRAGGGLARGRSCTGTARARRGWVAGKGWPAGHRWA